jgi:hypothetical protein
MGTISKTVQHRMKSFRPTQMTLDQLTQQRWWDVANYLYQRGMKYGTAKLKVAVVVKPQIDTTAATPSPTPFAEHMQILHIVHGQFQMLAVMS